jgi:hypothetical protein
MAGRASHLDRAAAADRDARQRGAVRHVRQQLQVLRAVNLGAHLLAEGGAANRSGRGGAIQVWAGPKQVVATGSGLRLWAGASAVKDL